MEKICKNCKWFSPFINPATNRRKSTEKGECKYPLPWPAVWPVYAKDFIFKRGPDNHVHEWQGYLCETFEPSETAKNKAETAKQLTII